MEKRPGTSPMPDQRSEDSNVIGVREPAPHAPVAGNVARALLRNGSEQIAPDYALSRDWMITKTRLDKAQLHWASAASPSQVLLINGAARSETVGPAELLKSALLLEIAREALEQAGVNVDVLNLGLLGANLGRNAHPCKGRASSLIRVCDWPCGCYLEDEAHRAADGMSEIFERWTAAHAVMIVSPVHWHEGRSPLRLMIDRMACARLDHPPGAATRDSAVKAKHGERAVAQQALHLAGRAYGLIVHGEVDAIDSSRFWLSDWLDAMGLSDAMSQVRMDRYLGFLEPIGSSHHALDVDGPIRNEARDTARTVAKAVIELRVRLATAIPRERGM
jgi:multimeric flavodoxin WrbA